MQHNTTLTDTTDAVVVQTHMIDNPAIALLILGLTHTIELHTVNSLIANLLLLCGCKVTNGEAPRGNTFMEHKDQ